MRGALVKSRDRGRGDAHTPRSRHGMRCGTPRCYKRCVAHQSATQQARYARRHAASLQILRSAPIRHPLGLRCATAPFPVYSSCFRRTNSIPSPYLRRCTLGFPREIRGCSGAGRAMVRRRWGVVFPLPAGESQNSGCSPQLLVARGRFGGNSLVRVAGGFFSRSRCVYARVSQRVRAENSPELWGTGRAPTAWEAAQPQRM